MRNNDLFGQRNITHLKFKINFVVFYSSKEDQNILNRLRDECNTYTCQYVLIPIYIQLVTGSTIDQVIIRKNIKTKVSGFKKNLDEICIINPNQIQSDNHIIFDLVENFKIWFIHSLNKNNPKEKEKVQ